MTAKQTPIKENEFALMMADGATGHILTEQGEVYHSTEEAVYVIFSDLFTLNEFVAEKQKKDNSIDFSIFNNKYELIEFRKAKKWD